MDLEKLLSQNVEENLGIQKMQGWGKDRERGKTGGTGTLRKQEILLLKNQLGVITFIDRKV